MTGLSRRGFFPALFVCCFLITCGGASAAVAPKITEIKTPSTAVMVGNSYFYYNNSMHNHTRHLIDSAFPGEKRVFMRLMSISAGYLREHEGGLSQMIKSRKWDMVILQGQSTEAIATNPKVKDSFVAAAKKYAAMLKENNIQPAFFMSWARSDKPEMIDRLAEEYTKIANETDAVVIPAGLAFRDALAKRPALRLHDPDRSHPSLAGTYLSACTIYSVFFKKSPEGLKYDAGLDAETVAFLQKTAWETTKAFYGW